MALRVLGADTQDELADALRSGAGSLTLQTAFDALVQLKSFASINTGALDTRIVADVASFVNGRLVVDTVGDAPGGAASSTLQPGKSRKKASEPSRAVSGEQFRLVPRILGLVYDLGLQDTPLGVSARRAMRGTFRTASAPLLLVAAAQVCGRPGAGERRASPGRAVSAERAAFETALIDAAIAACGRGGVRDTSVLLVRSLRRTDPEALAAGNSAPEEASGRHAEWFRRAVLAVRTAVVSDSAATPLATAHRPPSAAGPSPAASEFGSERRHSGSAPADRANNRPNVTRHPSGPWRTLQQGLMALSFRNSYGSAAALLAGGGGNGVRASGPEAAAGGASAPGMVAVMAEPCIAGRTTAATCEVMLAWHEGLGVSLSADIEPDAASRDMAASTASSENTSSSRRMGDGAAVTWQDCLRLGWAVVDEAAWLATRSELVPLQSASPLFAGRAVMGAASSLLGSCPRRAGGGDRLPEATHAAVGLLCGAGFAMGGAGRFLSASLRPETAGERLAGSSGPSLASPLDTLPVLVRDAPELGAPPGGGLHGGSDSGHVSLTQSLGMPSNDAAALLVRCCVQAQAACESWLRVQDVDDAAGVDGGQAESLPSLSSRELCFASRAIATALSTGAHAGRASLSVADAAAVRAVCAWITAAVEDEATDALEAEGPPSRPVGRHNSKGASRARQQMNGRLQAMHETLANVAIAVSSLGRLGHQSMALEALEDCENATDTVESCALAMEAAAVGGRPAGIHGRDASFKDQLTRLRVDTIRAAAASARASTSGGDESMQVERAAIEGVERAAMSAIGLSTRLLLRHSGGTMPVDMSEILGPVSDTTEDKTDGKLHQVVPGRIEPLAVGIAGRLLPLAEACYRARAARAEQRGMNEEDDTVIGRAHSRLLATQWVSTQFESELGQVPSNECLDRAAVWKLLAASLGPPGEVSRSELVSRIEAVDDALRRVGARWVVSAPEARVLAVPGTGWMA